MTTNRWNRRVARAFAVFGAGVLWWDAGGGVGLAAADDAEVGRWVQWRGPNGQGVAPGWARGLPTRWSESENVVWKTDLPGRGWSSPVVWDGRIWLTAAVEIEASPEEAEKRLASNTGDQPLTLLDRAVFRALCVDAETGRLVHDIELMTEDDPQWVHRMNSYASPTPVIEEGRLYCHFGTFGTACVDTGSAAVVWTNRELRLMHENGPGSSPILWGDAVIFHGDGSDVQFVAALDKRTGEVAWKADRSGQLNDNPQLKKGYATPAIARFGGRPQLLSPGADWLYSYDPATGRELWKLSYETLGFSNVPPPLVGDGMIYLPTCFMRSELLGIRYDGEEGGAPEIAWRYRRNVPTTPAPILHEGLLYFTSDQGGIVTCLDAATGDERWKERIRSGNYSASPLLADGRLWFFSREGVTTVLQPGDAFEVVGENTLDGAIYATPAVLPDSLLIRTDTALYRIGAR